MSLPQTIIYSFELFGMISGSYVGWRYGNKTKKSICSQFSPIEKYRRDTIEPRFKGSQISEEKAFNVFGVFFGIFIGYRAWFITIPMSLFQLAEDYPLEFKKIKDCIKKG